MATYYIKNGGNDSLNGLSDTSAWATISKLLTVALSPGDSVLFNRGNTWKVVATNGSDALTLTTYSGTEGNRITYGAYGTGNNPVITAKDAVVGWDSSGNWMETETNVWRMTTTINSGVMYMSSPGHGRLWLNGVEVLKEQSITTPSISKPWTHNGQDVYVYATSNPSTYYSNIESVGVNVAPLVLDINYIIIQNIDFHGGGNQVVFTGSYCIIENCTIGYECSGRGIYSYGNQQWGMHGLGDHNIIRNNNFNTNDHNMDVYVGGRETSFNNTEDAISMYADQDDWLIYGNTFLDWGHSALEIDCTTDGHPITNVKFYNNYVSNSNTDYGRGVGINVTTGNTELCRGIEIYNNFIYNTVVHNQLEGSYIKFYNNIIDTVRGDYWWNVGYGGGGINMQAYAGPIKYNEVYNNVIVNTQGNGIHIQYSTVITQYNSFKNNIIFNCGNNNTPSPCYPIRYETSTQQQISNNIFENNIIYSADSNINYIFYELNHPYSYVHTLSAWEAHDGNWGDIIRNNISGDPLFVDATNANYLLRNYNLSSSSPAIGAGINVGLTTDYAGNLWNATPSIGAYEYTLSLTEGTWLANRTTLNAMYQRLYQLAGL